MPYNEGVSEGTIQIIAEKLRETASREGSCMAAIDGRCASGKTTLAGQLGQMLHCPVFHLDDYFLQPYQRTAGRYGTPGENVDWERFEQEVLRPWSVHQDAQVRRFDCETMCLEDAVQRVPWQRIMIAEGSYSLNTHLRDYYNCRIFLTVDPEEQLRRLRQRNPAKLEKFRTLWIPLEEQYFTACHVQERCDIVLDTTHSQKRR